MRKFYIILVIVVTVTIATFLAFVYTRFYYVRELSIAELVEAPESYDGTHVKLHGYIVEGSYTFGPKYVLKDNLTKEAEIPLGGKGVSKRSTLNLMLVLSGMPALRIAQR